MLRVLEEMIMKDTVGDLGRRVPDEQKCADF